MKVLITGAGGMLGQDVAKEVEAAHHQVVALTKHDLDITDAPAVNAAVALNAPDTVINCAAYTAVDMAESDPDGAFAINEIGAGIVARAAAMVNATVIYPSTDYVFDGAKGEPYVETDIPNPLSKYGQSKLAGEIATAENPRHMIVRTSWLFGLGGRNFVETMLSLAEQNNEVLVVRDQVGSPTYTRDLASALVLLLDMDAFGVHHLAGGGFCSWWDFAVEIFRQAALDMKVLSGTTDMLARPAPRPAFAPLETARIDAPILPRWDHGLHSYLLERAQKIELETIGIEEH